MTYLFWDNHILKLSYLKCKKKKKKLYYITKDSNSKKDLKFKNIIMKIIYVNSFLSDTYINYALILKLFFLTEKYLSMLLLTICILLYYFYIIFVEIK